MAQLCFIGPTQTVEITQDKNTQIKPEIVVFDSPTAGKFSVRDQRAAFFYYTNPHTQGRLFIERVQTSTPDLSIFQSPKSPLFPGESGEIIAIYNGKNNITNANIQVQTKLVIEFTNNAVQTLTVQIQKPELAQKGVKN